MEQQLIESVGEMTPEMEAALLQLEIELPTKVDRYAGFMDRLNLEAQQLSQKSQRYSKASSALSNLAEKLESNLKKIMVDKGLEELRGKEEKFKLVGGKGKIIVESVNNLPEKYKRSEIIVEPRKDELYAALKKGEIIKGVTIEPTRVLKRSVNKT